MGIEQWNISEENGGIAQIAISHRIHGAAIYGNMDPINIPPMLAYILYMDPMGIGLPEVDIDDYRFGINGGVSGSLPVKAMGMQVLDGDPVLRPLCQRCPLHIGHVGAGDAQR